MLEHEMIANIFPYLVVVCTVVSGLLVYFAEYKRFGVQDKEPDHSAYNSKDNTGKNHVRAGYCKAR